MKILRQTVQRLPIIPISWTYCWRNALPRDVKSELAASSAHAKLVAAITKTVTTKALVFALNCCSSKIPGSWRGDEVEFARHYSVNRNASYRCTQKRHGRSATRCRCRQITCSVFLGRGHVSLSVLSVSRWGHVSLSLTSFMTPSSLLDEFTPTKDFPLTYSPSAMMLLLENYNLVESRCL